MMVHASTVVDTTTATIDCAFHTYMRRGLAKHVRPRLIFFDSLAGDVAFSPRAALASPLIGDRRRDGRASGSQRPQQSTEIARKASAISGAAWTRLC
jgi:hypothetical protein